jgi:hypothetical protein
MSEVRESPSPPAGSEPGVGRVKCPECAGRGLILIHRTRGATGADGRRYTDHYTESRRCSVCLGAGWITPEEMKKAARRSRMIAFKAKVSQILNVTLGIVIISGVGSCLFLWFRITAGVLLLLGAWSIFSAFKRSSGTFAPIVLSLAGFGALYGGGVLLYEGIRRAITAAP